MFRHRKCLAAAGVHLLVLALLAGPLAGIARAAETVDYSPPVDALVTDPFRAPNGPYGAGNRGLDYKAEPGQEVRAAGDGEVVFVGPIAGSTHVVVLHADGIRTSYSFLASAAVGRGQRVVRGQVVGRAAGDVHFGARAGDAYLDPADLFAGRTPAVRLVPLEPLPEAGERRGLLRFLRDGAVGFGRAVWNGVVDLAGSEFVRLTFEILGSITPQGVLFRYGYAAGLGLVASFRPCTSGEGPPPNLRDGILIRVSGLGSNSEAVKAGGGIGGIDPADIGMDGALVHTFSYGSTRSVEEGASYGSADTLGSLESYGADLAQLIARVRAENPGRPIVIVAHSQGGLVAREALRRAGTDSVAELVTLATPHHGSDLATAGARLRHTKAGQLAQVGIEAATGVDIGDSSVSQLAETSDFINSLGPLPEGLEMTSIAKAGDPIVPIARTHVGGADNRVVPSTSALGDHFNINSDPAAHREVRLALAGAGPACRSVVSHLRDRLRSEVTSHLTDVIGLAAAAPLGGAVPGIT